MASSIDAVISSLKGYFGGSRRTPEQKVEESSGLFDRLLSNFSLQDPRKKPKEQQMLSPVPDDYAERERSSLIPPADVSGSQGSASPSAKIVGFTGGEVPSDLLSLIQRAAREKQINEALLSALLFQESRFNPGALGGNQTSRDRGIAQINSVAYPGVTDEQAYDPSFAVPFAANLLRENIDRFGGDISRGVAAYNVGPGGASVTGPAPFGGGPRGQQYIDSIAQYLDPQTLQELGLIVSP